MSTSFFHIATRANRSIHCFGRGCGAPCVRFASGYCEVRWYRFSTDCVLCDCRAVVRALSGVCQSDRKRSKTHHGVAGIVGHLSSRAARNACGIPER